MDSELYPPLRAAWMALALLLLAYTCSFIDRQILSLLVHPIRTDLAISDTQLSLLQGISFAFFYSILGIPFGMVADRWHRRNLIIAGLLAWSVATAFCGLADTFGGMFIGRMAVGVGEACLAPAAYSLISDSFRPEHRGRALTLYSSGSYVGAGLALVAGGGVIAFSDDAASALAQLGFARAPWQTVFLVVSLFGIILAPFLLLIREPLRRGRVAARPTIAEGLRVFRTRATYYVTLVLALSFIGVVNYSFLAWTPTIFERRYGWQPQEIGPLFGIILMVLGPGGTALGGYIVDKVKTVPSDRMAALLCVIGTLTAIPSRCSPASLLLRCWPCSACVDRAADCRARRDGALHRADHDAQRVSGRGDLRVSADRQHDRARRRAAVRRARSPIASCTTIR